MVGAFKMWIRPEKVKESRRLLEISVNDDLSHGRPKLSLLLDRIPPVRSINENDLHRSFLRGGIKILESSLMPLAPLSSPQGIQTVRSRSDGRIVPSPFPSNSLFFSFSFFFFFFSVPSPHVPWNEWNPRPRLFLGLKKSPSRTSINRAIPAEGRWDWTAEPVCPSIADPIDGGFGLRRRSRSRYVVVSSPLLIASILLGDRWGKWLWSVIFVV